MQPGNMKANSEFESTVDDTLVLCFVKVIKYCITNEQYHSRAAKDFEDDFM